MKKTLRFLSTNLNNPRTVEMAQLQQLLDSNFLANILNFRLWKCETLHLKSKTKYPVPMQVFLILKRFCLRFEKVGYASLVTINWSGWTILGDNYYKKIKYISVFFMSIISTKSKYQQWMHYCLVQLIRSLITIFIFGNWIPVRTN